MEEASSIITLDDIIDNHSKLISARAYKQRVERNKSITLGKVEASCAVCAVDILSPKLFCRACMGKTQSCTLRTENTMPCISQKSPVYFVASPRSPFNRYFIFLLVSE